MYIMYMNNISWALHLAYYTVDTVELFTKVTRSHRNCFFFCRIFDISTRLFGYVTYNIRKPPSLGLFRF